MNHPDRSLKWSGVGTCLNVVPAQVAELKQLQAGSAVDLERLGGAVLARAFHGEL
jgi:hypothetical protein